MLSSRLVCRWIISITEKGDTKSHYGGCATYSELAPRIADIRPPLRQPLTDQDRARVSPIYQADQHKRMLAAVTAPIPMDEIARAQQFCEPVS